MPALILALVIAAAGVQTDPIFVDANRLFNELEFEQATFRYEQLALRRDLSAEDRALVLMWLGTSQAKAGDLDNAARSYELALSLDPSATVPTAVSPKVVRLVDAIVEKLRKTQEAAAKEAATKEAAAKEAAAKAGAVKNSDKASPDESPSNNDKGTSALAPESAGTGDGTTSDAKVETAAPREQKPGAGGGTTTKTSETSGDAGAGVNDEGRMTPTGEEAGALGTMTFPLAIGSAAGSALVLIGSVAAGITGALLLAQAFDLNTKQADAQNAYTFGIVGLAGAGVLAAGTLALAGGATSLLLSLGEE